MRKIMCAILVIALAMTLASCSTQTQFCLLNDEECITRISITEVSYNTDTGLIQAEIKEINDIERFMKDFRKVKCRGINYGSPPMLVYEGETAEVIKIEYANGEYDLIDSFGQAEYRVETNPGLDLFGFFVFEEETFRALISRYLEE